MPRIVVPDQHHPSLQFRYELVSNKLPSLKLYGRSSGLPTMDQPAVALEHINGYFNVKGKTRWQDISVSCYAYEGITFKELYDYLNNDHHTIQDATDYYAPQYKHDLKINVLGPDGSTPTGTWTLVGAFFQNVNWGDMAWDTDDAIQCELTITYDYATYEDIGPYA